MVRLNRATVTILMTLMLLFLATTLLRAQIVNEGLRTSTGRWMEIPDNPTIALPVFTAEAWVKCMSGGLIVTRDHPTGTPSDWQLWYHAVRNRLAFITATSPPDSYFYTPDNSFLPNRWYHVALVVNGPAGTARLYLNGALVLFQTFTTRDFSAPTGLAWGGYYGNASGAYLNGFFDEAKYWNIERTQSQIVATKDIAQPMNDRIGLMGYWRFCGNYADSSGNGNHGIPQGNPTISPIPDLPFGINCVSCTTALPVSISPRNAGLCDGNSLLLSATPGFAEYHWSNGSKTRTTDVTAPGKYQVTVLDSNGCYGVDTITVYLLPGPVADAGPDTILCSLTNGVRIGRPARVGQPPYRYEWQPAGELDTSDIAQPVARPSASTIFRVRVTDANGCISEDSVLVGLVPELLVTIPDTVEICEGDSIAMPVTLIGGIPPYRYRWSPTEHLHSDGVLQPVAKPPSSRWYYVEIQDTAGCSTMDSVYIRVYPAIQAFADGDTVICAGDSVQLNARAIGGKAPYSYHWSPAAGLSSANIPNPLASPSVSTRYFLRVTDALQSLVCIADAEVMVSVSPQIIQLLPDSLSFCDSDSIRLPLEASGGLGDLKYAWQPESVLDNPHTRQPRLVNRATGWFRVRISDSAGCAVEDSIFIHAGAAPELLLPDTVRVCNGLSVQLPLTVLSTADPLTFKWDPPTDLSSATARQPIASPKQSRMYHVRVTDRFGCWNEDSVFVELLPLPSVVLTADGPTRFCEDDSVRLTATPGFKQYRWMLPSGQVVSVSNQRVVSEAGTYRVVVTDSNGCEAISNQIVVTRPLPFIIQVIVHGSIPLCAGDSLTLEAPPGYRQYSWKNAAGVFLGNTRLLRVGDAGRFTVSVRDSLGCEGVGEILVTLAEKPKPTIDGPLLVCINSTHRYVAILKAGNSYRWRVDAGDMRDAGLASITTINWNALGLQRLTLRMTLDSSGCSDSITVLVRVVDKLDPVITASGPRVICEGDSVMLRTAATYASWTWLDSSGSVIATSSQALIRRSGRYVVRVTSADGCNGSDTVDVTVLPRPAVSIIGPRVFCAGDTAEYSLAGSGSKIRWTTTGGDILASDTGATVRVYWRLPGSGTLRVRVEVEGQPILCPGEDEIAIRIGSATQPWVIAQPDSLLCEGDSAVLVAQPGFAEYRWRRADGTVLGDGATLRVGETGLYYVTVRDSLGCEATSAMKAIHVKDRPATEFTGPRSVCVNTVAEYCVTRIPTSRYRWVCEGGTPVSPLEGPCVQIQWTAAGRHKLMLFISDDPCDWVDSAEVVVGDSLKPDLGLQGPITRCEGDSLILDAGAGYTSYEWSTPYGAMNTRSILAYRSGRYVVRVTDAGGCGGSSDPIDVLLHPGPAPLIAGPEGMCPGDTVTLRVAGSYRSYRWSDGSSGASTITGASGVFRIEVVDSNGCIGISPPHTVSLYPLPAKPRIARQSDSLRSTAADRYQWYHEGVAISGADAMLCRIQGSGAYTVRTWNAFGCWAESDPFLVEGVSVIVMLPDIFVAPGERVRIPLTLMHGGVLDGVKAGAFDATVRMDRHLVRLETDATVRFDGRDMLVDVTGTHEAGGNELTSLDVTATLGDISSTPLTIESFRWLDSDISTRLVHGSLRIDICEEGGERLFSSSGRLRLYQNHPNPFNAQTVIRYELIELGQYSLYVLDALGRRVLLLAEGYAAPGAYQVTFDGSELPGGLYSCVLRTATQVLHRRMLLIK
jgi:hypothetical protein